MPKALQFTLAVLSSAVAFSLSTAAFAGSVTKADLAGKKICWSSGAITTYGKDGSVDCDRCGHGTWRLVGDTLTEHFERGSYVWKAAKDGLTLHLSLQTAPYEVHGSYCK
jgi:hypothetical protein